MLFPHLDVSFDIIPILMGILIWGFTGLMLWRRQRAGATFLELGEVRNTSLTAALATLYFVIGLWFAIGLRGSQARWSAVFFGTATLYIAQLLYRRVQVRERGIVIGLMMVPWGSIVSYDLSDEYDILNAPSSVLWTNLTIRGRKLSSPFPFPWPRRLVVRVPIDQRDAVAHLLQQHVARKPTNVPHATS